MIATFFRWQVAAGREQAFRTAWNEATLYYLEQGSHGSSLWQDGDGHFCAFALWPDRETRAAAFASEAGRNFLTSMAPLVEAVVDRVDLDQLDNHWRLPANAGQSTEH